MKKYDLIWLGGETYKYTYFHSFKIYEVRGLYCFAPDSLMKFEKLETLLKFLSI
jgi:hypothetical protein